MRRLPDTNIRDLDIGDWIWTINGTSSPYRGEGVIEGIRLRVPASDLWLGLAFLLVSRTGAGMGNKTYWIWDGNLYEPTLEPSILHNETWHGYLRKGKLVDA